MIASRISGGLLTEYNKQLISISWNALAFRGVGVGFFMDHSQPGTLSGRFAHVSAPVGKKRLQYGCRIHSGMRLSLKTSNPPLRTARASLGAMLAFRARPTTNHSTSMANTRSYCSGIPSLATSRRPTRTYTYDPQRSAVRAKATGEISYPVTERHRWASLAVKNSSEQANSSPSPHRSFPMSFAMTASEWRCDFR
jgi:hypothetical protein